MHKSQNWGTIARCLIKTRRLTIQRRKCHAMNGASSRKRELRQFQLSARCISIISLTSRSLSKKASLGKLLKLKNAYQTRLETLIISRSIWACKILPTWVPPLVPITNAAPFPPTIPLKKAQPPLISTVTLYLWCPALVVPAEGMRGDDQGMERKIWGDARAQEPTLIQAPSEGRHLPGCSIWKEKIRSFLLDGPMMILKNAER